ncbi:MAG: hydroxypyruvate isomerase [Alphaproteobacteria bacterium]|nr:hydroxypyruvate isomerase [Alphaproteobacteria bacterium]
MPKFAANLTMMFNEVDFPDRFQAAAEAGFEGVEYLFPYDFGKEDIAARLQQFGLTQVLHNLPAGDWGAGERGIAILPDRVEEFRAGVDRAIEYAKALDCPKINCLAGIAPEGMDEETLRVTFVENLAHAAAKLGDAGIKLLIEPINTRDIPGFFLTTTRQGLDILAKVGSDNLFIQYDIYHMQVMEGDLAPTIEAHLDKIAHIQLADTPGRHEPGSGEINYPFLFDHLDKVGYTGWVGCEYKPAAATLEGLGWFAPYARGGRAAA